MLKENRTVIPS